MKTRWLAFSVAVGLLAAFSGTALAAPHYSEWGTPVSLGCGVINTAYNDFGPGVSKDGLSLYFGSDRAAPGQPPDIYVSQRPSVDAPWGTPVLVPNVNYVSPENVPATENVVSLSRDGHWMFFNSNRPDGLGDIDIWASYRAHIHDDFDWQTPVNLGPGVNSDLFEAGASYFENDGGTPQLFFGRGQSSSLQFTTTKIMVSEQLPDGTFGNAHEVTELNLPGTGSQRPSIRFDGLEIFFYANNRSGGVGGSDIWVAERTSVDAAWDEPTNLGSVVNTPGAEFQPHISANGLALYFATNRTDGACGGWDIYVTTRLRVRGGD
jgi:hypothetical protein